MKLIVGWVGVFRKRFGSGWSSLKFTKSKKFEGESATEINERILRYVNIFSERGLILQDQEILYIKDKED